MMSCAPTETEYPQVWSGPWSSASQDDTYSAAGEAIKMLRWLWGWPTEQRGDKVQNEFVACVAA